MKGNQLLGIGFLILSITLIFQRFVNLPDFIYLTLLIIAILFELVAVVKMNKEKK